MAAKKKRAAARKPVRKAAKPARAKTAAKSAARTPARKPAAKAMAKPYPVVPYLTVSSAADAIEFYKRAFAASENMRMPADDGKRIMHCSLAINGGTLMLSDSFPEYGAHTGVPPQEGAHPTVTVMLDVDVVDAWFERAVSAGATAIMAPENMFWGGRFSSLRDPFGHFWSIHGPLKK